MAAHLTGSAGLWGCFALVVLALLSLDLGLFQRTPRDPSPKEALAFTALYALLACVFGAGLTATLGARRGAEFFTAYVVEQSLSVDNLFVMMVVFAGLGIARAHQRRVLVWGIIGATVLRGVLIFAGAAAVARFHVLGWLLGALLVGCGVKLARAAIRGDADDTPGGAPRLAERAVALLACFLPITKRLHGDRFTVVRGGVRHATPLLVALVTIELADAIFALDSIPAVLGVSNDALVILTSNVFAILGLRAMYFALADLLARLHYLKHGLAAVLVIVGAKMLVSALWVVPTWLSLSLVVSALGAAAVASLVSVSVSVRPPIQERNDDHVARS
jgi:tellurite resistance protein TerC